ncbi:hypothetical protein CVO77_19315 [Sphingopyxis lindanitolerans]|uniref:Uncharacterized protein n=2 Tax=Sphingopyxis lindanitolerans TaxID=2054227 RepID=A0A2S8B3W9_9SPHN|nr:hypothetical protein CVO77_19315 [Sphingopyxis lindanitolerans]
MSSAAFADAPVSPAPAGYGPPIGANDALALAQRAGERSASKWPLPRWSRRVNWVGNDVIARPDQRGLCGGGMLS